jgi:energy-coupling factor transporter ATP-binding protein EcfA2
MPIDATVSVATPSGSLAVSIKSGSSVVFIGANGSGKTRLGVHLERHFANETVETHRIAAHRSLVLNPNVVPPNLEIAVNRLLFGRDDSRHTKEIGRWGQKPATILLNDFDHVLSALYAENNDVSVAYRTQAVANPGSPPTPQQRRSINLR